MLDHEFCIISNENDVIECEKKMYEAYSKKTPEGLSIVELYEIIDNNRMKSKIEYKNLINYILKVNGIIEAGLKVNFNIENNFTLEDFGFKLPENKTKGICEGINFFALGDKYHPLDFFNLMEDFLNFIFDDLRKKGFKKMFGVCDEKIKVIFLRADFKIIDEKEINEKKILLLEYNFN